MSSGELELLTGSLSKLTVTIDRTGPMLPVPADDLGEAVCTLPARTGHPPGSVAKIRETDLAAEWLYHTNNALATGMDLGLVTHLRGYIDHLYKECPWGYDERPEFPNQATRDLRMELGAVAAMPVRALNARKLFLERTSRVLYALLRLLRYLYHTYCPGEVAELDACVSRWEITL